LTYEFTGTVDTADYFIELWVEDVKLDEDVYCTGEGIAIGDGTLGVTIPSGALKNGKVYVAGVDLVQRDQVLNQPWVEFEYESNFLVSSSTPNESYVVYYTTYTNDEQEWFEWNDYPKATWTRLVKDVSGEQQVTVPAGATGIKIETNGRTLIDGVTFAPEINWANADTYWDDHWGNLWFADWHDWQTVDGESWHVLGDGAYMVITFDPLVEQKDVTITPPQQ